LGDLNSIKLLGTNRKGITGGGGKAGHILNLNWLGGGRGGERVKRRGGPGSTKGGGHGVQAAGERRKHIMGGTGLEVRESRDMEGVHHRCLNRMRKILKGCM